MTTHSLLACFNTLINQHYQQFTPPLRHLRATVETTVQQLQAQEQALVAAQAEALSQVRSQLALDARILLNSIELDAFVFVLQAFPERERGNEARSFSCRSARWLLAQREIAIRVFDYATFVNHPSGDDDRTEFIEGDAVTLEVQGNSRRIEVVTRSIKSPIAVRTFTSQQQIDSDIKPSVVELLAPLNFDAALQSQLVEELSYLVCCATQILALVPQRVQFQYSSLR